MDDNIYQKKIKETPFYISDFFVKVRQKSERNRTKSERRNDKSAKEFVNVLKKQITFFRENSDEYSYVFYIMKKC